MEKNIINLDNFRPKKSNYNVIEYFNLGAMSLVLDPCTQIQIMKSRAMTVMNPEFTHAQQIDGLSASYLLSIAEFLCHGVFMPFDLPFNFTVRRDKETNLMSLLGLCMSLNEMSLATQQRQPPGSVQEYIELEIEESNVEENTYKESMLYADAVPVLVENWFEERKTQAAVLIFQRVAELVKNHRGKMYRAGNLYIALLGVSVAKSIQIVIRSSQFAK